MDFSQRSFDSFESYRQYATKRHQAKITLQIQLFLCAHDVAKLCSRLELAIPQAVISWHTHTHTHTHTHKHINTYTHKRTHKHSHTHTKHILKHAYVLKIQSRHLNVHRCTLWHVSVCVQLSAAPHWWNPRVATDWKSQNVCNSSCMLRNI